MKAQDLKNSILQLAIQGKLVSQDENDEPAEVLYAKIQAEKQKLIKEGKIKKDKPLPPITEDEIPFSIPPTWKWVRLGEIEEINLGFTYKPTYVSEGIYFLSVKNITKGQIDFSNAKKISQKTYDEAAYGSKPHKGDILFGRVCSIGNPQIVDTEIPFCIFVSLGFLRDHTNILEKKFICVWMRSPYFFKQVNENVKGAAQKNLNTSWLSRFLIPLPPLEEQKRIVAKIEELEPLINQYDQAEQELSTLNDKFPEQLKKSILQYAIQGKLVAQDDNDEPAEVLYAKIQAEKQKLIKEGKIKKDKPLPPITEDEIPFLIPPTWKWVRLGLIFNHNTGKALNTSKQSGKYHKYLTTSNVYWNSFNLEIIKEMKFNAEELEKYTVSKGDLLVCEGGDVGRAAIWNSEYDICIQNHIHKLRAFYQLETLFFYYIFMSYKYSNKIDGKGIGIKGLSSNVLHNLIIPLPPLEEQHRIVAKVNELLQACDKLHF